MEACLIQEWAGPIGEGNGELPGQIGGETKGLGIEEVAPASNGLSQGHGRHQDIKQGPKGQFPPAAIEQGGEAATQECPMDGDPAMPDREGFWPIARVLAPFQGHVIGPGPNHGPEYQDRQ